MSKAEPAEPVKLFCGIISAGEQTAAEAVSALKIIFGDIDDETEYIPFNFTSYYEEEMGPGLLRKFVSFSALIDPARLAAIKIQTNGMEESLALCGKDGPRRRVNLDPGYVTPTKLVLASAKDFSHRIYLHDGIYAEITMQYERKRGWQSHALTFPDFESEKYREFFTRIRAKTLSQLAEKHL